MQGQEIKIVLNWGENVKTSTVFSVKRWHNGTPRRIAASKYQRPRCTPELCCCLCDVCMLYL